MFHESFLTNRKATEDADRECREKLELIQRLSEATNLINEYKDFQIKNCSTSRKINEEPPTEARYPLECPCKPRVEELERDVVDSKARYVLRNSILLT